MLTQLNIQNFTLIENLELQFNQGMTIISGETGAGKSIILDALGLAMGDRADSDMVRINCERADISAYFDISALPDAESWLKQQDIDHDGECLLRRVVSSNGRSRAYINGHPTPLQNLRHLGEKLIDIHGQHEHQKLLKKDTHCTLLDSYAVLTNDANSVKKHFQAWHTLQRQLQQIQQQSADQQAEVQLLRYQIEELDQLAPEENELQQLEQEQQQLENASQLLQTGDAVRQLTTDNDSGSCRELLSQALQQLSQFNLNNPEWDSIQEMLNTALIQVEEASAELEQYLSRVEIDPQRLQSVEDRLSSIYQVARKHQVDPDVLPKLHQQLLEKLALTSISDEDIENLQATSHQAEQLFLQQAKQLTQSRTGAAEKLNLKINQQLKQLGMPNSHFVAQLTPTQPSATGLEEIEFLISTNPGQPAKPLSKVASGGELSRISLAIQVVTAQTSSTPVLAFDEVDVGIGGAIAEVVGRLLRELGKHSQILCVTHQPQVASRGHNHLYVSKQNSQDNTHSQIERLNDEQRIKEIARMLGGIDITQRSLDHAAEMLATH